MILTRRQFLKASAALVAAPAIVKAENLMKIYVPPTDIEPLPYRGHFRVPDLRGHFATNPEPMNLPPQREMTATEVLARRDDYRMAWDKRWTGHMARQKSQDAAMKTINRKIDDDVINGLDITGVWVDEAASLDMSYQINDRTGETLAAMSRLPGHIPCDGRELSAIQYPDLYAVLGNKYG